MALRKKSTGSPKMMTPDTRIDNALVWFNGKLQPLSLVIAGEQVSALVAPADAGHHPVQRVVDARGLWLLPGGVDLHVHISDGAETFTPGTCCAAAGGITTVLDMAPFHACVTPEQLRAKAAAAEVACVVDFGLVAGIVVDASDLEHLQTLADSGAAYFKVFQPSEPPLSTETLWKAVQAAAHTGLRLGLHAEETACLLPLSDPRDPYSFPRSRPAVAETSAVAQLIEMARAAGAPVHVCHISASRTAELVAWGKAQGVDLTCETTPHFLALDEEAFAYYGARVKTTPPLRSQEDMAALWQALRDGVIDAIACDHYIESLAPQPADVELIPTAGAGIGGLETSLPMLMDAVMSGELSLKRFVEASAEIPATLAGLAHRKGRLAAGMDADFVLWDPQGSWTVRPQGDFSRVDTSPFFNWELHGKICATWLRGQPVWNENTITAPAGYGRWAISRKG
jgi:allantoinase